MHGRILAVTAAAAALVALAGCGGVKVQAQTQLPRPLVDELPLRAGLYFSPEFRAYEVHEKRWSTQWSVTLGPGHVAAIERLAKAMFAGVVTVPELAKPPAGLGVILEPRFEEYSFLTPRDAGAEIFAVTIKYRINIYDGQARLIDSLVLTGFGNEVAGNLSSSTPLAVATRKAMRDAGAKFAAEFPDQLVIKKLARHEAVEPIATGAAGAGEGSVGEVQPAMLKAAPPPSRTIPPAPAASPASAAAPAAPAAGGAPAAAPAAAAAGPDPSPATPPAAAPPAPDPAPATSPAAGAAAGPATAPVATPASPPAPGAPPTSAPATTEPGTPAPATPATAPPSEAPAAEPPRQA